MKNVAKYSVKLVKEDDLPYNEAIKSPQALVSLCQTLLGDEPQEVLVAIALDTKNKPIGVFEVHRGAINRAIVAPRDVFMRLFSCNASNYCIVHNHPSGDTRPSQADTEITKLFVELGMRLEVQLLDHIIIGDEGSSYSYRQFQPHLWM